MKVKIYDEFENCDAIIDFNKEETKELIKLLCKNEEEVLRQIVTNKRYHAQAILIEIKKAVSNEEK